METSALIADIKAFMREHDCDFDSRVRTQEEWLERNERWGNDAICVITQEGGGLVGQLCGSYYYHGETEKLVDEWNAFLKQRGAEWSALTHWAMAIYPRDDALPVGGKLAWPTEDPESVARGFLNTLDGFVRSYHDGLITIADFEKRQRLIWEAIKGSPPEAQAATMRLIRERIPGEKT